MYYAATFLDHIIIINYNFHKIRGHENQGFEKEKLLFI